MFRASRRSVADVSITGRTVGAAGRKAQRMFRKSGYRFSE
jgi:hypothetical protein